MTKHTCPGFPGQSNTNRNDPICDTSPKVAKAFAVLVTIAGIFNWILATNFANGNMT